jgi:IS30 family transposase
MEALMKKYHQLTDYQRYQLAALRKEGHPQKTMAANLGVHPSTISRELGRNQGQRGYRPHQAQQKTHQRRQQAVKAVKMTAAVIAQVEEKLRQEWSPEQIAGWLPRNGGISLSHERIYQHVRADRQAGGSLYTHLRQGHKKRKKRYGKPDSRGQIRDRVSIEQRPEVVEKKSRIGDWEIDLVVGHKQHGALVTLVERRSRYTVIGKVATKQAEEVATTTIRLLEPQQQHTHTITADNGKEFAAHQHIGQALQAQVYFAHPYHSWERGLNENTNGLIRQYFPKGTDFEPVSDTAIQQVMDRLNHRPRKALRFRSPYEVWSQETGTIP